MSEISDDICGLCYHQKDSAKTCKRHDCESSASLESRNQNNIVELAERRRQKMLNKPKDRGMEMLAYAMLGLLILFVGILLFVVLAIDWQ